MVGSRSDIRPILERLETAGVESSGDRRLDPEVYRDLRHRLSWLALIYSFGYLAADAAVWTLIFGQDSPHREHFWQAQIQAALSIGFGLGFFLWARRGKLPPRAFGATAVGFEVVAGLGIMWGAWGWEHRVEDTVALMGQAQGLDTAVLRAAWIDNLVEHGLRPLYAEGVPWVGVWLVVVPIVLPLSTRATVLGSLLTACTVPLVAFGSPAVHGYPDTVAAWGPAYATELTAPAFVCAGIAILGSRVIYRLTHQLSRARRLGSYQLVERIGSGGMGEVWKAKHRMLVRPAAIKLIRPEALGASQTAVLRRFEREAQVIATLTSPHTVVLYDFGVTGEGDFYYVMEMLDGLDLRTLVEKHGPLGADRTRRILAQACHSLDEAHAQGLIHRDVKPGNIFVCRRGNDLDVVKVLDFGLVKEAGVTPGQSQLTMDGIAAGTPAFMAPEMALGRAVDGRTDVYGLGCVAFWMLTGQVVFSGDTALSIVTQHVSEPPPRPSAVSELDIPAELERIVLDCLAKDPTRRPQSAAELARRLREIEVTEEWTPSLAARWWGRHLPAN